MNMDFSSSCYEENEETFHIGGFVCVRKNQQCSSQEGLRRVLCLSDHRQMTSEKWELKITVTFLPEPLKIRRGGMIFPVSFAGFHTC
jgi:hypothetical protein